jgi:hypothetical protein
MRFSTVALAGAFVLVAGAAYADDLMANTYGNTVTTKSEKTGQSGSLMFNADGSYSAKATGPDGKPVAYPGKWMLKDGGKTICLSPGIPNPPPTSCSPLETHAVGSSWVVTNDQGETFDITLSAGR